MSGIDFAPAGARIAPAPVAPFLFALLFVAAQPCSASPPAADAGTRAGAGHVRINQLGFLPAGSKLAIVESDTGTAFRVVREGDGEVVLQGQLGPAAQWEPARRTSAVADLGQLREGGHYRVEVDGMPASDPFPVRADAYAGLADAALKGFYFTRSGTALDLRHAGRWARPAGHPDDKVEVHPSAATASRPAGTILAAPAGWYDAGDYNKYVVNSGISTWTLLAAYEHFPGFFRGRDLGIPESGDAVPDILDEAWWNLRWMLEMQDPADGGVYHKLSALRFEGTVMPDKANARRYMIGRSTAAALDFAAVMAIASRVYAPYEAQFPGMPARMRSAAESAWRWAQANPDLVYRQPSDVHTGAYGGDKLDDEFAWAAAELLVLTGDAGYREAFERHARTADVPGWSNVGTLGWISLAAHGDGIDAALRERSTRELVDVATRLAGQSRQSAWRMSMQRHEFVWGSNAVALNHGVLLLQGYRLSQRRELLDAAQSQLDYVLGRNPLGVSFVTGQGIRTPMHIHHRPSQADGITEPVPGLLSGGPNPGQQDRTDCRGVDYASSLPALSWLDDYCSYASNEIAINWNAPLVYVAAGVQALTPRE